METQSVSQLQLLQQNAQNVGLQKQQFETQLVEIDSALTELSSTQKAYRILGKIMIASSKEEIIAELEEKKRNINLHIKNLIKQEDTIQENIQKLQQKVMNELQQKNE